MMCIQWRLEQRSLAAAAALAFILIFTLSRKPWASPSPLDEKTVRSWRSKGLDVQRSEQIPSPLDGMYQWDSEDLKAPPLTTQSNPELLMSQDPLTVSTAPTYTSTTTSTSTSASTSVSSSFSASASVSSSFSALMSVSPSFSNSSCRITKVSMLYDDFLEDPDTLEACMDTQRRHCERWGCEYKILDRPMSSRRYASKLYFVLSVMLQEMAKPEEERTEWLLWVDADTIVLNPSISPCLFLPPPDRQDVVALLTADESGLNSGVFYLKVDEWALELLIRSVSYPLEHPEVDLGWSEDQKAQERVFNATYDFNPSESGVVWMPKEWFNAYERDWGFEGEPGHFIVHFPGFDERFEHMVDWLHELHDNQTAWEIPMHETFYRDAVPKFWRENAAEMTGPVPMAHKWDQLDF